MALILKIDKSSGDLLEFSWNHVATRQLGQLAWLRVRERLRGGFHIRVLEGSRKVAAECRYGDESLGCLVDEQVEKSIVGRGHGPPEAGLRRTALPDPGQMFGLRKQFPGLSRFGLLSYSAG
jgi:hypothetical protein